MQHQFGVTIDFTFDGEHVHRFSSYPREEEIKLISAPPDVPNTSFEYSGRHDHGPMAEPRQGGPFACIAHAILAAKHDSNSFLSSRITQTGASLGSKSRECDDEGGGIEDEGSDIGETDDETSIQKRAKLE
jgi:hypothetical protein